MPPEPKSGMLLTEGEILKALGWERGLRDAAETIKDARRIEAAVLRKVAVYLTPVGVLGAPESGPNAFAQRSRDEQAARLLGAAAEAEMEAGG